MSQALPSLYKFVLIIQLLIGLLLTGAYGQTTSISDPNFEQDLVDQGIDSNGLTGNIVNSDAEAINTLNLLRTDITDLAGLEAFVNLQNLNLNDNQLASIPLATLTALESLDIGLNGVLTALDLSNNTQLTSLDMTGVFMTTRSPMTTLDLTSNLLLNSLNITSFQDLTDLRLPSTNTLTNVYFSQLSVAEFDFGPHGGLEEFSIIGSRVNTNIILPNVKTSLRSIRIWNITIDNFDIGDYINMESLELNGVSPLTLLLPTSTTFERIRISQHRLAGSVFSFGSLPNLEQLSLSGSASGPLEVDLSTNFELKELTLNTNQMSNLDITQNVKLERLALILNEFTSLDVTKNILLKSISASDNQLSTIDLSQNPELDFLSAPNNQIDTLDITNNIELTSLDLHNNLLSGNSILNQFHTIRKNSFGFGASDQLDVSHNNLFGKIPNFEELVNLSFTNFFELKYDNNAFHFGDFEDHHSFYVNMLSQLTTGSFALPVFREYTYAPQDKVDEIESFTRNAGESITLVTTVRGEENHYKWFKDGVEITGAPDSPEYIIRDISSCDAGVYHAEVTSDLVPFDNLDPPGTDGKNLLLVRNDITLTVNSTKSCVNLIAPLNGSTDVPVNTNIQWVDNPAACSYKVTVGTTSGGTDIVDNEEVLQGNVYTFTSDLPANTQIFVSIVPVYDDGDFGGCTEESFVTGTDIQAASCTTLNEPLNGAVDVAINTLISWNAVDAVDGYRVTLGTSSGSSDILDNEDVGSLLSYQPTSDLPDGTTIYVTIIPYNTEGDAIGCSEESFSTVVIPKAPACTMLTLPVSGTTDVRADTNLEWSAVSGATGYRLTVGTTATGAQVVDNLDVGNVLTYDFASDLVDGIVHFVTIIPYNDIGDAIGCSQEFFVTAVAETVPGCTSLTLPLDGASNVSIDTDLEWATVDGATGYRITLGTTTGGSQVLDNFDVGNVLSYDLPTDLIGGTTYFITITPYNRVGDAMGCVEESFTTEVIITAPNCTPLTMPTNNAVDIPITTNLEWSSVAAADGYRLTVGTTSGGTELVDNEDLGDVVSYDFPTDLAGETTYYVTIIPYNSAGDALGCIEESFTTEMIITAPSCTSLTMPANNAVNVPITTNLEWSSVAEAAGYRLVVGTTSGGTELVDNEDLGDVLSYDFSTDLAGETTYYITIIPYNSAGDAVGCIEESFTTEMIITAPSCTSLTMPANNAVNVPISANLEWPAVAEATGYRLTVGTTPGGAETIDDEDLGDVLLYDFSSDLAQGTTYFVTITPYNSAGKAIGCRQESFTTETIVTVPGCTSLTLPIGGSADVPVNTILEWSFVNEATGYRLSVGTTSNGRDVVDNLDLGNTLIYDFTSDLAEETTYFVNITPYNDDGDAIGCQEESFTTELIVVQPMCTSLVLPLNGAVDVPVTTGLEWSSVDDATGYRLSVGTATGATDIVDNLDVGDMLTFDFSSALASGLTYYVTILPYNSAGNAVGCSEESFTVAEDPEVPSCTMLISPLNGSVDVLTNTSLVWNEVPEADGYLLTVGTSPSSADILDNFDIGQETNYVFSEILPQNTEIFVTITPYNIDGVATTCLQESFETASDEGQEIKLGFSPDGDGINDFWQIAGIEKYPDNFVTIYNRWGDIVFEISGYNNRSQVFRGTANRYVSAGAKELPEGTYFFHIRINGAHDLERVKGYLVLKR